MNAAKIARAEAGVGHPDLRAGHGGDHRHAAGRARHRRRGGGGACARRAADRPELRDRPAGDGGACALAVAATGPACSACSPMPACRSWWTARRTTRSAPAELASWMERFVVEDGLNLIGGCCGTSTQHIAALDAMLRTPRTASASARRRRSARPVWVPSVASLYAATPLRQENSYFSIGERCNANGSKAWRERQAAHDWDGCVVHGPRAGGGGLQQPRHLHRLRRPRRDGGDERGDPPLHRQRERAAGDRQHRDAGDRGGAEAARRQADHQLDQLRGWRGRTRTTA